MPPKIRTDSKINIDVNNINQETFEIVKFLALENTDDIHSQEEQLKAYQIQKEIFNLIQLRIKRRYPEVKTDPKVLACQESYQQHWDNYKHTVTNLKKAKTREALLERLLRLEAHHTKFIAAYEGYKNQLINTVNNIKLKENTSTESNSNNNNQENNNKRKAEAILKSTDLFNAIHNKDINTLVKQLTSKIVDEVEVQHSLDYAKTKKFPAGVALLSMYKNLFHCNHVNKEWTKVITESLAPTVKKSSHVAKSMFQNSKTSELDAIIKTLKQNPAMEVNQIMQTLSSSEISNPFDQCKLNIVQHFIKTLLLTKLSANEEEVIQHFTSLK